VVGVMMMMIVTEQAARIGDEYRSEKKRRERRGD
jgi:hypothetical protein